MVDLSVVAVTPEVSPLGDDLLEDVQRILQDVKAWMRPVAVGFAV